jgi:hypothetical protein
VFIRPSGMLLCFCRETTLSEVPERMLQVQVTGEAEPAPQPDQRSGAGGRAGGQD